MIFSSMAALFVGELAYAGLRSLFPLTNMPEP